ncbi:hypothetical protein NO995_14655 [Aestuariibaculum sp. M13]|nr:hypothetical protein [Aestuariibaculum sp. M13]MCR8668924.1 hypothetical protein [Aestuariibaculum sp. M13]
MVYNTFIDHCRKNKNQDLFFEELRQNILRELIKENKEYQEKKFRNSED